MTGAWLLVMLWSAQGGQNGAAPSGPTLIPAQSEAQCLHLLERMTQFAADVRSMSDHRRVVMLSARCINTQREPQR